MFHCVDTKIVTYYWKFSLSPNFYNTCDVHVHLPGACACMCLLNLCVGVRGLFFSCFCPLIMHLQGWSVVRFSGLCDKC